MNLDQNRIELVRNAYQKLKTIKELPDVINVTDESTSKYYRGLNFAELMLLIATGKNILNPFEIMHVETDREKALPYAVNDLTMPYKKRETLLDKLRKLGIDTDFLGPGILLGLTEEVYLFPSLGDHGYTIRAPYSMNSIDQKTRNELLILSGIDVYHLPK
ncbi:MAG: hypothetical protein QXJ06_04955 [Candidatus Aenigmatarchaeota archaeon]